MAQRGLAPTPTSGTLAMATIPAAALATILRVMALIPCSRMGLTM